MFQMTKKGAGAAVAGVVVVTLALVPFRDTLSSATVALTLLLVVLLTATYFGAPPAYLAAVISFLSLNFFFLRPFNTFSIAGVENWIALFVFLITALVTGELSGRARRRAEEAQQGKIEIERLYKELQGTFARLSEAEALRRSEQLKTALLDAVTHDLRTPLTSIKASVTTLLKESNSTSDGNSQLHLDDEGRQEMLEVINEESDRLNHFIEGIVELARIQGGDLEFKHEWGPVDEMIAMAAQRAQPFAEAHSIVIEVQDELPLVRVDPRAVAEVVYLLIDNAAKYSPANTRIAIRARREKDEFMAIEVEDEGVGIPNELREKVFDKFFRARPDVAKALERPSGMGMGLAIARGIVQSQGGRIWIEDGRTGRGTRIIFTIPIGDE